MGGLCVGSDPTPPPKVRSKAADTGEVFSHGPHHASTLGQICPSCMFHCWGITCKRAWFQEDQAGS